jgi:glutamate racemase
MSQLREALKRKIEKQKEWADLTEEGKKELVELMEKSIKDGRQKAKQKGRLYR